MSKCSDCGNQMHKAQALFYSEEYRRGQGTIEYLLIIAVVIVISLFVVSLVVGFGDPSSVNSSSQQVGLKSGPIAVMDSIVGEDAKGLISVQNNSGELVTIKKVLIDGVEHPFRDTQLFSGDKRSFLFSDIVPCTGLEKKSYSLQIVYESQSGLLKTVDYGNVNLDCTASVSGVGDVLEEIAPRFAYFRLDTNFSGGIFNYTKLKGNNSGVVPDGNISPNSTGLVGLWHLNGNATDSSGNGNNGTWSGTTDYDNGLWDDNSANFNGSSSIQIDSNFGLGTVMTLSAWVYLSNPSTRGCVVNLGCAATTDWSCESSGIGIGVGGTTFDDGGNNLIIVNNGLAWDQPVGPIGLGWHNLSVVMNSDSSLDYYIDGIYGKSYYYTEIPFVAPLDTTQIGGYDADGYNRLFTGKIDEVAIWNRALSAEEIQADYNRALQMDSNYLSPVFDSNRFADFSSIKFNSMDANSVLYNQQIEPTIETDFNNGLVGLWHMNESNGTTVVDSSGNGNNGTYINGPTVTTGLWSTNARSFDGVNDYASIPLSNFDTAEDFSLFMWIKIGSGSQNGLELVEISDGTCSSNPGSYIRDGQLELLNTACNSASYLNVGLVNDLAGSWHQIGYTYSTGYASIYKDGEPVIINQIVDPDFLYAFETLTNPSLFVAGARDGTQNFNATIEEISLHSRVLSSSEVNSLFNKGAAKIGVQVRSCASNDCSIGATEWSSVDYNSNNLIGLSGVLDNRYFQFLTKPSLYSFPVDLQSGLVGLWNLDGNALDASGNDNNGTWSGNADYTDGNWGQAANFDGIDSQISIPHNDTLTLTGPLTLSAWVKVNTMPTGGQYPNIAGKNADYAGYMLFIHGDEGQLYFAINNITGTGVQITADATWHHWVGVYNGATCDLYKDGQLENTAVCVSNPEVNENPFLMGVHYGGTGDYGYFDGAIDEVSLWDRSLSMDEIKALYVQGPSAFTYGNILSYRPSAFAKLNDVNLIYTN